MWSLLSRGEEFGFALSGAKYDWQQVVNRSRDTADGLAQGVAYLMKKNGVDVLNGTGRVTPLRKVEVRDGEDAVAHVLEANHILIATGQHAPFAARYSDRRRAHHFESTGHGFRIAALRYTHRRSRGNWR